VIKCRHHGFPERLAAGTALAVICGNKKPSKKRFDLKLFVFLPSIVRGEIRTVEGNLCLYLVSNIWKI